MDESGDESNSHISHFVISLSESLKPATSENSN